MELKSIKDNAKYISNFRSIHCSGLCDLFMPESKLIQFDLLDIYNKWNNYLGKKDLSFSRFLSIYHNDLLLTYALKEAILSLNRLDVEKWKYKEQLKDWEKMNLMIKSHEAIYHLVNLAVLLRINYERFILCLQELFQCNKGKKFEAKRKAIIIKLNEKQIDKNLIKVIESIDIGNLKEYREKIIHKSGLYFQEFFPSAKNNLDFDAFLSEIRNEIVKFYILMQRFIYYSIGEKPKFNLNYGHISKEEFNKRLKKSKSKLSKETK